MPQRPLQPTERDRQRLVAAALNFIQDTPLVPTPYELRLLDKFARGVLTIDQVLACLEAPKPECQEPPHP